MRKLLVFIPCMFLLSTSIEARPFDWFKHHKLATAIIASSAIGVGINAWGLHHCRTGDVEQCTAHYGAAWLTFGIGAAGTGLLAAAAAHSCWNRPDTPSCKPLAISSFSLNATQTAWGINQYRQYKPEQ